MTPCPVVPTSTRPCASPAAATPELPSSETIKGKSAPAQDWPPTAAAGYSSYGNQIGLATGHVCRRYYHPGYVAKHMELRCGRGRGSRRRMWSGKRPAPGDVVILLGGRTGRDGIGGATGSSKSHNLTSLDHHGRRGAEGQRPRGAQAPAAVPQRAT